MGVPPRWTAGSGADLRVQGLERRRRRRLERDHVRRGALGGRRFATIDPEEFYDFQATRPRIKLVEGHTRQIVWPEVELYEARVPRAPRDLILLSGSEPSFRWRTFSRVIVELAEAIGVQLVVTLGALLADVPHTRPVSVTGLASDPALVARLGLTRSSYEGPTGIVGVLHAACQDAGLPSASLWAAVPHYIAAAPNPKAALALVRKLEGLVGVAVDASELESAAADYERQVNLAVQSDPDVQAFVERLEQAAGRARTDETGPLPSGETIARDLQRFLRQRGGDEPGPDSRRRPTRRRKRPRDSPLGRRAHEPVVAHRARRERRRRLEPLREDPLGDLHRDLAGSTRRGRRRRPGPPPSGRRARSSRPAGRRRGSTPRGRRPRTATAARRRRAASALFGRPVL